MNFRPTSCPWLCRIILALFAGFSSHAAPAVAASDLQPFTGARSTWHDGFARYDYLLDEATGTITPFTAPEGERFGVRDPDPGKRRCIVVAPKNPASGHPWSWRGCYWDHEPQTEVELLKRGFHVAYISSNATLRPGKEWEAWYTFLTEKQGLSPRPAFIGMSRGGEYAYTWATAHPDKAGCIYADNPGGNREVLLKLGDLATNDVPLLHVCGSIDPLLGKYANVIEGIYQQWGGRITTMIKEGKGHHPHSLRDPKPIADWIEQNWQSGEQSAPAFVGAKFIKSSYYGEQNFYREFPGEGVWVTCRGPGFVESYSRIQFAISGVEGNITVVVPTKPAASQPWVFRSDLLERDASVDQQLLAKGFHVVTGPVTYNADGPILPQWNAVYQYLVERGFSKKPILEGRGGAAGDAFAWAIANPDKVSCIYVENPILLSKMAVTPLVDSLASLATFGVPILHACGSLDPHLANQTRVAEKRYQDLGGSSTVILREGVGHYPMSPVDSNLVADLIIRSAQ